LDTTVEEIQGYSTVDPGLDFKSIAGERRHVMNIVWEKSGNFPQTDFYEFDHSRQPELVFVKSPGPRP
jgi:hypothetical protein